MAAESRDPTRTGEAGVLRGEEQQLTDRHSAFSDGSKFVTSAVLRLQKGDKTRIRAKMEELAQKRRASQPLEYPSAGSTFKRPVGGYAAALIRSVRIKGTPGRRCAGERKARGLCHQYRNGQACCRCAGPDG